MGKAITMDYISKGFQDRIEVSVGNVSRGYDDKFALVGIKYVPATFKCELCGHEPCLYSYSVENLETDIVIEVGSECIKHFKDKGCNIDVAEGLRKRIKSVTRKMRRYMKKYLEEDQYKEMNKETKRELTLKLFMKHQAMEALKDDSTKRSFLAKEDVTRIIEDTPEVSARVSKKTKKTKKSTPLSKAKEEVKTLITKREKDDLSDAEKKALKNAQGRVQYYKNKTAA